MDVSRAQAFLFLLLLSSAAFAATAHDSGVPSTYLYNKSIFSITNSTVNQMAGSTISQITNASPGALPATAVDQLLSMLGIVSGGNNSSQASAISPPAPSIPNLIIPTIELRYLAIFALILWYVFAAGKIADFLQTSGKPINKREALFAPFAYLLLSAFGILLYVSFGLWKPPQDTLVTNGFYLVAVPIGIAIAAGTIAIYSFFRDRLTLTQSADFSVHIAICPLFDGLQGYWTALGAAAVLVVLSGISFYSSGGQLALATNDFLLLSVVVSAYYLYKAFTAVGNEQKASSVVTVLAIMAPSIIEKFLRQTACAVLSGIPISFFQNCLLDSGQATLLLSIAATLILLVPAVPIIYAFTVNLLRALTLSRVLLGKGKIFSDENEGGAKKGNK